MRSSHASFVARLENSSSDNVEAAQKAEERAIAAVERERRVGDVLHRCSRVSQHMLAAYFRPDKLVVYWKELTHVLPLCAEYDAAKHGKIDGSMSLRMNLGNPSVEQRTAALDLRRAAERRVADAMGEYARLLEMRDGAAA